MASDDWAALVDAVRRFSRFYTRRIGVLQEGLLGSPFSLAEGRVLFELGNHKDTTATELAAELELDQGYLSRILRKFEEQGLLRRRVSEDDGRQSILSLTKKGRRSFETIDKRSREQVAAMLEGLPIPERSRLAGTMGAIEHILGGDTQPAAPYLLRTHCSGDMGWVVHRHGVLYQQEYGWDERFEALVARICAEFIERFDPRRERCWIAERDGEFLGCVFLVRASDEVAKLRLLLVEPKARGLGLGTRLVEECIRFAREARYKKITLWTNSVLLAARRIYERFGFQKTHEEKHDSFGSNLVAETWELELQA